MDSSRLISSSCSHCTRFMIGLPFFDLLAASRGLEKDKGNAAVRHAENGRKRAKSHVIAGRRAFETTQCARHHSAASLHTLVYTTKVGGMRVATSRYVTRIGCSFLQNAKNRGLFAGSCRGSYSPKRGQGRIAAITLDLLGVSTLTLPPSNPPSSGRWTGSATRRNCSSSSDLQLLKRSECDPAVEHAGQPTVRKHAVCVWRGNPLQRRLARATLCPAVTSG